MQAIVAYSWLGRAVGGAVAGKHTLNGGGGGHTREHKKRQQPQPLAISDGYRLLKSGDVGRIERPICRLSAFDVS